MVVFFCDVCDLKVPLWNVVELNSMALGSDWNFFKPCNFRHFGELASFRNFPFDFRSFMKKKKNAFSWSNLIIRQSISVKSSSFYTIFDLNPKNNNLFTSMCILFKKYSPFFQTGIESTKKSILKRVNKIERREKTCFNLISSHKKKTKTLSSCSMCKKREETRNHNTYSYTE